MVATGTVSLGVRWLAAAGGIAFVGLLWMAAAWRPRPRTWQWNVIEGADGRSSTSKFQWALWTAVIVASYLTVWIARAVAGSPSRLPNLPASLLTAMGLSSATMAAAKGITVTQTSASNPSVVKPGTQGGIFADDNGYPDLSKMQLVAWTIIAVGVFVTEVAHQLAHLQLRDALPDIDPALVVLMGLGQAAYLGKKLVTTTTPILTGISPAGGPAILVPPTTSIAVSISGSGFGDGQNGSVITLDNKPVPVVVTSWSDGSIAFPMPPVAPNAQPWVPGTVIQVAVIVQGQRSANSLPFTFT